MAVYYDQNKKVWYCKFSYKDWKGNTRFTSKTGFRLKREAVKYESEFKAKSIFAPNITLETLAHEFLRDYKIDRRQASYKLAETNIRLHILPYLQHMPVNAIDPLVIRKWQAEINELGRSSSTVYAINVTFKTLLSFAVKYYNLEKNPFTATGIQGKIKKRVRFLEKSEWEAINSLITNKYDKAVFNTLYCSGLRIGELLALTLDDIDFAKNTLNVNKQFSANSKRIGPPKTKTSNRVVTLPKTCMEYIRTYLDSLTDTPQYVFQLLVERTINARLAKYCRLAGVESVTAHELRHSHASHLIRLGIPVNAIAQRLGHSPAMTLKIYAHVYKDQDNEIAAMIERDFT